MSPSRRDLSPLFAWRSALASKDSNLTATERHVALTLSLHMSERGDSCFPSVPTLAEETGRAESTVRKSLRSLGVKGWVDCEIRGGAQSNRYRATQPHRRAVGSEGQAEEPTREAPHRRPVGSAKSGPKASTPPESGGGAHRRAAGTPPETGAESVTEDANGERHGSPIAATAGRDGGAAALDLARELADFGFSAKLRRAALAEPDRASAWLELAVTAADTNPAGYFSVGFATGDWPSPRIDSRVNGRAKWLEETSPLLDVEDAHAVVDGWRDLDDLERLRMHERIDELCQHLAGEPEESAAAEVLREPEFVDDEIGAGTDDDIPF